MPTKRVVLFVSALYACAADRASCDDSSFPEDLNGKQVDGLSGYNDAKNAAECRQACCNKGPSCEIFQFNPHNSKPPSCWLGKHGNIIGSGNRFRCQVRPE